MVVFIMLYKAAFESMDEILNCDHSNESYWAALSCGTVYYVVRLVLTFRSKDETSKCYYEMHESSLAVLSFEAFCFSTFFPKQSFDAL